jgi:ABC-type phosphate/phosphonate transport system substrate-binding protein
LAAAVAPLLALSMLIVNHTRVDADDTKVLLIGTSGSLTGHAADSNTETGACNILKNFIAEATGVENRIVHEESWCKLAEAMDKGQVPMGIFQGYEFAWAQMRHSRIRPLALAINGSRYPVACVVVNRDNVAKDFAGLEGQSLHIPSTGPAFQRLFVQTQCQDCGHTMESYFSSVISDGNVEDALDDVVDGKVQAAVVDQAVLEAYKARKLCRFNLLKVTCKSEPFPPVVVAYCDNTVELATLLRFQRGFKDVGKNAKGETAMMLLRITDFERIPSDFGHVLAQTRKAYPAPTIAANSLKQQPGEK